MGSEWDNTDWRGSDVGGNLKQTGTSFWDPPNTGATDAFGFSALPGGYVVQGGYWEADGKGISGVLIMWSIFSAI